MSERKDSKLYPQYHMVVRNFPPTPPLSRKKNAAESLKNVKRYKTYLFILETMDVQTAFLKLLDKYLYANHV